MEKTNCHIFLCRECGERWSVSWKETSPKDKVELAVELVKTDFEWHKVFCRTQQHLKQVNAFLGGLCEKSQ